MPRTLVDALGFVAAACTTLAFLPQVIQVVRSKSARDLSLSMFLLMVGGIGLWLAYGILTRDGPIIAANAVSLVFVSIILRYRIRYGTERSGPGSRS